MLDLLEIFPRLLEKEDSHSDSNFVGEKQDKFEDCLSKLKISNLELIEKHKFQKQKEPNSPRRLWTVLNSGKRRDLKKINQQDPQQEAEEKRSLDTNSASLKGNVINFKYDKCFLFLYIVLHFLLLQCQWSAIKLCCFEAYLLYIYLVNYIISCEKYLQSIFHCQILII